MTKTQINNINKEIQAITKSKYIGKIDNDIVLVSELNIGIYAFRLYGNTLSNEIDLNNVSMEGSSIIKLWSDLVLDNHYTLHEFDIEEIKAHNKRTNGKAKTGNAYTYKHEDITRGFYTKFFLSVYKILGKNCDIYAHEFNKNKPLYFKSEYGEAYLMPCRLI